MSQHPTLLGFETMESRVVLSGSTGPMLYHTSCSSPLPLEQQTETEIVQEMNNSGVQEIKDGSSNTFMVGERHY